MFKSPERGLNFKKVLSSFKVETNDEGPKIITLDKCIF